jgi:DNA polymerase I-like protein with 3'-5' exonuclease and polymerase domains
MRAMVLFIRALTLAGIPGGLILAVHDELVAEVPEEHAEKARQLLREAMIQAFHEYYPDAPLNGLVDPQIVKAWGEAKK